MAVQQRKHSLGRSRVRGSAVFRLCQRNEGAVRRYRGSVLLCPRQLQSVQPEPSVELCEGRRKMVCPGRPERCVPGKRKDIPEQLWNALEYKGTSFRQQDRPPEGRIRRQCDGGIKCYKPGSAAEPGLYFCSDDKIIDSFLLVYEKIQKNLSQIGFLNCYI